MNPLEQLSESDRHVDFGIVTIRDDEFEEVKSVLENIKIKQAVPSSSQIPSRPIYTLGTINLDSATIRVGIVQVGGKGGRLNASHYARDLIEDLCPKVLLVVGICGLLPDDEITLGDVVLASRVYDFSIGAVVNTPNGSTRESTDSGGGVHPRLRPFLDNLSSFLPTILYFGTTNAEVPTPTIDINKRNFVSKDKDTKDRISHSLKRHFKSSNPNSVSATKWLKSRPYSVNVSPINSSDNLIKDPQATNWTFHARDAMAVEMELGGVFQIAHRAEVPMLGIRGVSDVVGFKREPDWTKYACKVAAAVARGIMVTIKTQLTDILDSVPQSLAPSTTPIASQQRYSRFVDKFCHETATEMFDPSCVWGAKLHDNLPKVANTAEALLFCAQYWKSLNEKEQNRTKEAAEWISSQVTDTGLPSLSFRFKNRNTVHCTALGLQALVKIDRCLTQNRFQGKIRLLSSALLNALNNRRGGWRTTLCETDNQYEIRYIPTLLAIRALRYAQCISTDDSKIILEMAITDFMERKSLGFSSINRASSAAATLFLASEAVIADLLNDDLQTAADNCLQRLEDENIAYWVEVENYSIREYSDGGIEKVPFMHWSIVYGLDYINTLLPIQRHTYQQRKYIRHLWRLSTRLESLARHEPTSISSQILSTGATEKLLYPLFLVGTSLLQLEQTITSLGITQ
jgi:nucleoside phosphorylase